MKIYEIYDFSLWLGTNKIQFRPFELREVERPFTHVTTKICK